MARKRSAGKRARARSDSRKNTAAPTKSTSGGGFGFETCVVAASLLDLLTEQPLNGVPHSRLAMVSAQKGPANWQCDDLLLTYATESNEQILIPTSIKSYPALSIAAKRDQFVAQAWTDALGEGRRPRPLRLGHDRIGLFSTLHARKLAHTVAELIKKAREQGPDFRHNVATPGHLAGAGTWLSRLACPQAIAVGVSDREQQAFIASLELREFDFDSPTSLSYRQATNSSRLATVSESHDDGRLLWQELCRVAEKLRDAGGDISRRRLVEELIGAPRLKEAPRFADTWRRLVEASEEELLRQPRTIGRKIALERKDALTRLAATAIGTVGRVVIVCGPSGSGKSTIASLLCREEAKRGRALWLSLPLALKLAEQSSSGVLFHGDSLAAVLTSVTGPEAWLFLDGIDRATRHEQFSGLASILGAACATPWRIVITCQQEHWPRIRRLLTDAGVNVDGWVVTDIEPLSNAEVGQVTRDVPAILPVLSQPRLRSFATRPMVLDLLVKAAEEGDLPDRGWIGESHLVDWFWETRVRARGDISGSQSLMELGRRQADLAELDTAISDIAPQSAVEPLLKAGLLREHDERVVFDHDAVGDWARFRWLMGQGTNLDTVLEQRCSNPLWHSAIRLLAARQLEQSPSTDRWEALINDCEAVTDFALDALIFAADSENLLTRVTDRLFADEAKLAKRMIRRAVIVCTTPDRWLLHRAAAQLDSATPFLRTVSRDPRPFHFFWGPLLRFFGKEARRLAETAPKDGAELSKVWLQMTPGSWPHRDQAAEIALTIAEQTWADRQEYRRSVSDEDARIIYQASLAALREQPSRAKQFYLRACSLELSPGGNQRSARGKRNRPASGGGVTAVHWADCPVAEVDDGFREACFEGRGMECLFEADPVLAEQILLALMIDVRRSEVSEDDEFSAFEDSQCGLIPPGPGLSAPHYQQGPFLDFLRIAPRQAISLILRIVNFASERAMVGVRQRRPGEIRSIPSPVSESSPWQGNESVYCWNRARIDACARAVAPLTALEKWLGDRVANGEPINAELDSILTGAKSVAIAGVLVDLGRRHPQLFDGPLRPLLRSPLLLIWGEMQSHHSSSMLLGGPETRLGEWFFDEHKAWLFAEFRTRSILDDVERLSAAADVRWEELQGTPFEPAVALSPEEGLQLVRQSGAHGRHQWMATPQGPHRQETADSSERPSERRKPDETAIAEADACFRALSGGFRLQESALTTLRDELPDLREEPAGRAELKFLKRQARLGQATFLVVRHSDWLNENGLWEEYLAYVIRETSDLDLFFASVHADPLRELDWQGFLAPLAIELWAAEVDDPRLRSWVAHLAVFATGRAKRDLIAIGFAHHKDLGDRLRSLIHLVLRSAAAWWEMEFRRDHREAEFDLAAWWSAELQSFMSGTIAAEVPPLESLYLRDPPLRYANWRSDNRYGRDEDIFFRYTPLNNHNILAAVVHGTPLAAIAESDCEARERVALVRLALDAELAQLVAYDEAGNRLDMPCDEYPRMMGQRDVVERIAAELTECRDASVIAPLWEPVIGLGVTAPHWVGQLVSKWLWPNLALPEFPRHIESTWQEAIRFASNHENWRETSGVTKTDANELWSRLLGVDEYGFSLWRADHTAVIDRAAPLIEEKISELVASPRTAGPLLRWISRGPGRRFINVALQSISFSLDQFLLEDRDDDQLINCMAEFLDIAWQVRFQDTSSEPTQWSAFRAVLRHVATAGNPLAIDLEQRGSGRA